MENGGFGPRIGDLGPFWVFLISFNRFPVQNSGFEWVLGPSRRAWDPLFAGSRLPPEGPICVDDLVEMREN